MQSPNLWYIVIVYPLLYIFPAYVANGAPVIFGGGKPVDMNRKFLGKPLFGKHKTIRGTFSGLLAGFIIAFIESLFIPYLLVIGIALTIGTHIGDLFGSFVKRRMGTKEGYKFPIFDQYIFLIFALAAAFPLGHLPGIYGLVFIVALTGILHVATNVLAHKAHVKAVPW